MTDGIDDQPTQPDAARPSTEADGDGVGLAPSVRLGGRYTLEERLAAGGMAVVWRAWDEGLSRTVAVKVLRPGLATDEDAVARFRAEATTAARVAHPGIVAVYDTGREPAPAAAGTDGELVWLVLEHVDGPTVLEALRHHPRGLSPATAAAIGEQAAEALGHAHGRGLVHRDVKPANLILGRDGVVKLADFGIAGVADVADGTEDADAHGTSAGRGGPHAGTPAYAAPEQLADGPGANDPAVDVYALGIVLHECLTGRPAFPGGERSGRPLLPPRQLRPDVPRELDAVVVRATHRDPARRYADGSELAVALRATESGDPRARTAALVAGVRPADRTSSRDGSSGSPTGRGAGPADPPGSGDGGPAGGGTPRWAAVLAVLVVVGAAAAAAAVLLRGGVDGAADAALDGAGVPVAAVELFDPYASVGSGPTAVPEIADGDPTTRWSTPTYPVPLRSLGSPGVGVLVELVDPLDVAEVELELATPGVTVELLARTLPPEPGGTEADWIPVDRLVQPGPVATFEAGGVAARWWLVWFTELEPVGETWQAGLTDIRFRPVDAP